ncbi:MAG: hypothetical protein IJ242_02035 [Clostridia bacterium]|nr:hypothetical protein [Clostridia bacterium]
MRETVLYGFGDSNMWGWDARIWSADADPRLPIQSIWIEMAAGQMGWKLLNDSMPGRQIPTGQAADLFISSVTAAHWDVLLLMLGTNDYLCLPGDRSCCKIGSRWMETLEKLTKRFPERKKHIVLASPPAARGMTPAVREEMRHEYRSTAEQFEIRYFDTIGISLSLQYDGIHLDETGHIQLAKAVSQFLRQMDFPVFEKN